MLGKTAQGSVGQPNSRRSTRGTATSEGTQMRRQNASAKQKVSKYYTFQVIW